MKTKQSLLPVAKRLYSTAHKISPFMTLNSSQEDVSIVMKCHSLKEGQDLYTAFVDFFSPSETLKKTAKTPTWEKATYPLPPWQLLSSLRCPAMCSDGKLSSGIECDVCEGSGVIEYIVRKF